MNATRTIELTDEQAREIDRLVEEGRIASPGEIVQRALEDERDRDAGTERWLRDVVVPRLEAYDRDGSYRTADEVRERLLGSPKRIDDG